MEISLEDSTLWEPSQCFTDSILTQHSQFRISNPALGYFIAFQANAFLGYSYSAVVLLLISSYYPVPCKEFIILITHIFGLLLFPKGILICCIFVQKVVPRDELKDMKTGIGLILYLGLSPRNLFINVLLIS